MWQNSNTKGHRQILSYARLDRPKMSDRKYVGFQLAGMKCWKCHKEIGALQIPFDESLTPETLGAYLISHKILPLCSNCINSNPMFTSYENLDH